MMQDRRADHEVEFFGTKHAVVKVEAECLDAAAQFFMRFCELGEEPQQLRRDIRGEYLRVRQQPASREHAAAATRTDIENAQRLLAVGAGQSQAAIEEVDKVESLEVALTIGFRIGRKLQRDTSRRPVPVDEDEAVPIDPNVRGQRIRPGVGRRVTPACNVPVRLTGAQPPMP